MQGEKLGEVGGGFNTSGNRCLGSIGSVLLGKFCPLCYPVIGDFLSAIGFGFVVKAAILKGLLLILLAIGFLGLWRSYKTHKNPWPIRVALPAAILLYLGKYHWPEIAIFYAGIFGLIGAVTWDFLAAKFGGSVRCL